MTKTLAAAFNLSIVLATLLGSCSAKAETPSYQPLTRGHCTAAPLYRAAGTTLKATTTVKATYKDGKVTYIHTLEQGAGRSAQTVKVTF